MWRVSGKACHKTLRSVTGSSTKSGLLLRVCLSQQSKPQTRGFAAARYTIDEERQISAALRWMDQRKPSIVVQVEKIQLVGSNFLPKSARQAVNQAAVRIKFLTFCDKLSDAAISHQVAIAEESERQKGFKDTAIFGVDLSQSDRSLRIITEALYGASMLAKLHSTPYTCLVMGMPNAGKSSLILPLTVERTLRVKRKGGYHLPRISETAGRTLGLKKHVLEPISTTKHLNIKSLTLIDSPGLRPKLKSTDRQALAFLLAARVTEFYDGWRDDCDPAHVVELCLSALHRHALISHEEPDYVNIFGLEAPVSTGEEFLRAYQSSQIHMQQLSELDLVKACQSGDLGGLLFTPQTPSEVTPLEIERNSSVQYMNDSAERLVGIGNGTIATPTPLPVKLPKTDSERPFDVVLDMKDDYEGAGRIVQYPEHRRHFNCIQCAGFIKRDENRNIFGCRHTRVLHWPYKDILAYYSRMSEAFGGHNSGHVRYLMRDSLACTLMAKHKKRSRAAAYKLYNGIPEFPLPNHLRPVRFRSDAPIPLTHKCSRYRNSCLANESDELREKLYAPKTHPKMDVARKRREMQALMEEENLEVKALKDDTVTKL